MAASAPRNDLTTLNVMFALRFIQNKSLLSMALLLLGIAFASQGHADDPPSAVGAVMKLLKSGRVPESRLSTIVDLVGSKGNEHDLAFLFAEVSREEHWPAALRRQGLTLLKDAALTRKVLPTGDVSGITRLMQMDDAMTQGLAVELAGLWKVPGAVEPLNVLATHADTDLSLRRTALKALQQLDPATANRAAKQLQSEAFLFDVRSLAVATEAVADVGTGATLAAQLLKSAGERDDPAALIDAFLAIEGGSKLLAAAIEQQPCDGNVAKLALRHMFSVGRSDAELSNVLGKLAGINANPMPPTKEQVAALVEQVMQQGDAARGELVFRRADLSCMKCHAVSKAGGQIGPDLSALGASSPIEYVVTSVLDPDQAIKEAYLTKMVVTLEGRIHQGLVVDRTAERLILKDANGQTITVPTADIEEEVEGKSLMPKGLVKFMTDAEFLDLAKFLSTLGKPGPYAVRSSQRMQRWQILKGPGEELLADIPNETTFENAVLLSENWMSLYALTDGRLPLADAGESILYLRGEVEALKGGAATLHVNSLAGATVWVNNQLIELSDESTVELQAGRNLVTFRIDRAARTEPYLLLELNRVPGSFAEFFVVDGQ